MMNLLTETIDKLKECDRSPSSVEWIGNGKFYFTWEEFTEIANKDYDDGYGGNEVPLDLKVVGTDYWLERHEYDGSEWWEYKELPVKPSLHA
jgi:hypothetical protein